MAWCWVAAGCGALVAGLCLPLWARDGVAVNGWEPGYFDWGRWVVLAAGAWAVVVQALPRLRRGRWMALGGVVAAAEAALVLWRGRNLGAVGIGAWVLLLGAALLLVAAWRLHRQARRS